MPSLSDSIISLIFIIFIPRDLLDVASSSNYTYGYGSIRVTYTLVVDYSNDTIGREPLSQNSKSNLVRKNAIKNITVVICLFGGRE